MKKTMNKKKQPFRISASYLKPSIQLEPAKSK